LLPESDDALEAETFVVYSVGASARRRAEIHSLLAANNSPLACGEFSAFHLVGVRTCLRVIRHSDCHGRGRRVRKRWFRWESAPLPHYPRFPTRRPVSRSPHRS